MILSVSSTNTIIYCLDSLILIFQNGVVLDQRKFIAKQFEEIQAFEILQTLILHENDIITQKSKEISEMIYKYFFE